MKEMKGLNLSSVVTKLKNYAPLCLAEKWDNVGLLIEPSEPKNIGSIMLTNDLTLPVLFEAIQKKADMIISYHPPIFSPLKKITSDTWKQELVVKCIENRIALYSPHTCYDSLKGGVNDWLLKPFDLLTIDEIESRSYNLSHNVLYFKISHNTIPEQAKPWLTDRHCSLEADQDIIKIGQCDYFEFLGLLNKYPSLFQSLQPTNINNKFAGCGPGRIGKLKNTLKLTDVIDRMKQLTGNKYVRIATAYDRENKGFMSLTSNVETIAVCAGSGSSVLNGVKADVYITGAMSHHEILDAVHNGCHVILLEHCNSERGFLDCLKLTLENLFDSQIEIFLSENDHSPLQVA